MDSNHVTVVYRWTAHPGKLEELTSIYAEVTEQMQQLPYYNNFFQCSNQPAIELAKALVDVTPANFNHVFFTNSGSEANDTNLRLVSRYYEVKQGGAL